MNLKQSEIHPLRNESIIRIANNDCCLGSLQQISFTAGCHNNNINVKKLEGQILDINAYCQTSSKNKFDSLLQ